MSKLDSTKWLVCLVTREKSLEPVSNFLKESGRESIKALRIEPGDTSDARLNSIPMSIAIDENGVVMKVLTGLHKDEDFGPLLAEKGKISNRV